MNTTTTGVAMAVSVEVARTHVSNTKLAFTVLAATSIEWYDFFLYGIAAALMYVPAAALVTGMFDKSVRCSAAALSYQLGAILGGGLAPILFSQARLRGKPSRLSATMLRNTSLVPP